MAKSLDLRLEKRIEGLSLMPYVSITKRAYILESVWRNYRLNSELLKKHHEGQLAELTNPSSLSSDVIILPNPKSAHQNVQGLYYSDVVSIEENEEMFPNPRLEDFVNITGVKLKVSAKYSLANRASDLIFAQLNALGYEKSL